MTDLFSELEPGVTAGQAGNKSGNNSDLSAYQPLAAYQRPKTFTDFVGQRALMGEGAPLRESLEAGRPHSMILWGPPGVGKTTLARLVATATEGRFVTLSAVTSGVKEVREAIEQAKWHRQQGMNTVLFIDEVHRFNKSQQDGFLPHIEDGTIVFIGATTENPGFELNRALLSRCKLYVLERLSNGELQQILTKAMASEPGLLLNDNQIRRVAEAADGDARRALNLLEVVLDHMQNKQVASGSKTPLSLSDEELKIILGKTHRAFDKGGDHFYDLISALHKSVRGSDPDASIYWFARMLEGGCDPLYLGRRLLRMASEDIGNADPRALDLCHNALSTYERLGSPEGELALAQAALYLASAPKSNAVYRAYKSARAAVSQGQSYEVPKHIRNAPTSVAKAQQHGAGYRYDHDEPGHYAPDVQYLPDELCGTEFYKPSDQGLEAKIGQRLAYLREQDRLYRQAHNDE